MTAQYKHVIIKGIPPVGGKPGIRKEFSKWSTEQPETSIQVSLFIRALQRFYARDYKETLSYFQVASIHGFPGDLKWDNSDAPQYTREGYKGHHIYCTHNLQTFPTWHRPYMALFEQTVHELMGDVIKDMKFARDDDKQTWIDASNEWRLPYWDWALPQYAEAMPFLLAESKVKIREPMKADGSPAPPLEVDENPLARYQLKVDDVGTKPWSKCSGTSRHAIKGLLPTEEEAVGKNEHAKVSKALAQHKYFSNTEKPADLTKIRGFAIGDLVSRLMSTVHSWEAFSTTATSSESTDWKQWISLEYIHNNLHVFIGGNGALFPDDGLGHMSSVPVSAFDPIFYFHHCNVDRIFALWQVLNPKSWFADKSLADASLSPFHGEFDGEGVQYFNSTKTYDCRALGYDYDIPRVPVQNQDSGDSLISRLKYYLDDAYTDTSNVVLEDEYGLFAAAEEGEVHLFSEGDPDDEQIARDRTVDDYIANVIYDRYGYNNGEPYTIHFHFGVPNTTPHDGLLSLLTTARAAQDDASPISDNFPRHAGSVYTFSMPMGTQNDDEEGTTAAVPKCGNCAQQQDEGVLSRATVPLTVPLYQEAGAPGILGIHDMESISVENYLDSKLSWVAVSVRLLFPALFIPLEQLEH
ncbi:common central domain of tyrosinase-domain-containing protein [Podospora didyma]|uniref:tyrosinase n=1 Tax=Podospora didyma TaxID=330526 RepID=A0AAE0KEL3_9PEZI|nr:common central domain of tyrosinase-domain-containing protein [Podospora didyma]